MPVIPKRESKPAEKADTIPKNLKAFLHHGARLTFREGSTQATGDCLFCGREEKFYVATATGKWECKRCTRSGNPLTFIRQLWEVSKADEMPLKRLAAQKGILDWQTLVAWEVRISPAGYVVIPGRGPDGRLNNLYRYWSPTSKIKPILQPTPGFDHQLFGVHLYDPKKPSVAFNEGFFDAAKFWEVLRATKKGEDGKLLLTSSESVSLYASLNVLGIPGCNVYNPLWSELIKDKNLTLLYDNDHPLKHPQTGAITDPAAYLGMKRICSIVSANGEHPNEINYLRWSDEGTHDPELPHGYDVGDHLSQGKTVQERIELLPALLDMIHPIPEQWIEGRSKATAAKGGVELDCISCNDWKTLVNSWRKAMKWTEGLDRALSVMLACITSTKAVGDQLWVRIISPAATGKSTLCEAVSVNKEYVYPKSTIRGLHSGTSDESGEDYSLLPKLKNKTLVVKDGDTILSSESLQRVLSEFRDVYDTVSRSSYRTKQGGRNYEGYRITVILCGTNSLRQLDTSELGERFLTCSIMDEIDPEVEDDILLRVANRAERNMGLEAGEDHNTHDDPAKVEAKQLTGGYISYLRENAQHLLSNTKMSREALKHCIALAKFIAYMRARPSKHQNEVAERELASRLAEQIIRLAKCVAVVLNRSEVDEECMRRTRKVTFDTSSGTTMDIMKFLHKQGELGAELKAVTLHCHAEEDKHKKYLLFLSKIGALEVFQSGAKGFGNRPRWRLSPRLRILYDEVMGYGGASNG